MELGRKDTMRHTKMAAWMRWGLAGAVLALWTLAGCGGAGDSADGGRGANGRVAVVLTDGPADDFDQINVTITGIELFSSTGEKVSVFRGEPRELNLLALAGESELFALAEVPSGTYEKIRLTVSSLELVRLAADGSVAESHSPSLPGNGKIDLNPRGAFHVGPGETVVVQLDLDARKSIHVVRAGNKDKYVFRPVVFVDVLRRELPGKLTRIKGEVQDVSPDGSFLLCPAGSFGDSGAWGQCVAVAVDAETSFFGPEGSPVGGVEEGDLVEAVGRFRLAPDADPGAEFPVFDALVVEIGTYLKLTGTVRSAPVVAGELAPSSSSSTGGRESPGTSRCRPTSSRAPGSSPGRGTSSTSARSGSAPAPAWTACSSSPTPRSPPTCSRPPSSSWTSRRKPPATWRGSSRASTPRPAA
jgi:hypothetical protein